MRKIDDKPNHAFKLNLGEYWRVLWRKKFFLLIPLLIAAVVSNIGVRFLVPIYEASTVVRIEGTSVNAAIRRFVQEDTRGRTRDAETMAKLESTLLGSAFLDELIRQLGMDRDPKIIMIAENQRRNLYPAITTEDLVFRRLRNFLKRRISVDREGPNLFRLKYSDANPEACYVLAEAITKLYIDSQQRSKIEGLQEMSEFSEEQLAVYKERLARSERALERFQNNMAKQVTDANPVSATNAGRAESLRNDIDFTIRNDENTLEKIRERLVALLGSVPESEPVWGDPDTRKRVNNLVSRMLAELLLELGAAIGPSGMDTAHQDVTDSQRSVQRHMTRVIRDAYPDIDRDYRPLIVEYFYQQVSIEAHRAKQAKLRAYIDAFRAQIALAPKLDSELTRLRQDVEHNRSLYNTFQSSRTSTQISEAVQSTELGSTIDIVENAAHPLAPVRPNKTKILVLAVVFGLTLGGGGILLTEFSDSSFRSVEEVESQLGLKVLGTIPKFTHDDKWYHDSSRKRTVVWVATSVVVMFVALSGFYFYGKSAREQLIDLKITSASQERG